MDVAVGWFADPIYLGNYPESMRKMLGDRLPPFTNEELALLKDSSEVCLPRPRTHVWYNRTELIIRVVLRHERMCAFRSCSSQTERTSSIPHTSFVRAQMTN
jgi:hypothetical protein